MAIAKAKKIVAPDERNLDKTQIGDLVFTGLFWEEITGLEHKKYNEMFGNKFGTDFDPTAFICGNHLVERHCVHQIAFISNK